MLYLDQLVNFGVHWAFEHERSQQIGQAFTVLSFGADFYVILVKTDYSIVEDFDKAFDFVDALFEQFFVLIADIVRACLRFVVLCR